MDIICEYNKCTGCQACKNACPKNAITILEDKRGFAYPKVDSLLCIDCLLCRKVCPSLNKNTIFNPIINTYAGWINDEKARRHSTSGGAAYAISKKVVDDGGVVFGCKWSKDHAIHSFAESIEELEGYQGSKYAYSDIGECYRDAQRFLKQGRLVLFTGTACQVAGLLSFLHADYDNLITIDILCHGIPSQKGLRDRILEIEKLKGKNINNIRFREKVIDQEHCNIDYQFEGGSSYSIPLVEDPFYLGFNYNYLLRPNCFECQYARSERISDITLADYWGYYPVKFSFLSFRKGVSLLLSNTEKGERLVKQLTTFKKEERDFTQARKTNPSLRKPQSQPVGYMEFWRRYSDGEQLSQLAQEYFSKRKPIRVLKNNWKTVLRILLGKRMMSILYKRNFKIMLRNCLDPIKNLLRFLRDAPHRIAVCKSLLKLDPDKKRVYYFGITEHANLGDMAQHYCIKKWIGDNYPDYELVMFKSTDVTDPIFAKPFFRNLKKVYCFENDIIIIQSGYSTQDLGGKHPLMHLLVCENLSDARILMMPQTVFFKSEDNITRFSLNHNKAKKMLFLARDNVSYEMAKKMFDKIRVEAYPDIVTTLIGTKFYENNRNGVCICTRNDGEKLYTAIEINKLATKIEESGIFVKQKDTQSRAKPEDIRNNLQYYIETEIESYSHYQVTITDRYHGTIFSLCAGTPVIIIKTNDHKVRTGADWFKGIYDDYVYVVENLDEAFILSKTIIEKNLNHRLEPYFKVAYYDKLKLLFDESTMN